MQWSQLSRLVVSLALLALAAGLFFASANPAAMALGGTIVGAITGYWLHVAERNHLDSPPT